MNKKIVIIDDDVEFCKLVEAILSPLGLTVFQALTGADGLKKTYEIHPDLIILDIMMPSMNGFEVCERIREMSDVPILMLTARADESGIVHAFKLGVDDYIKKPFNSNEFEARVRALLRRSGNQAASSNQKITRYADSVLEINLDSQTVLLWDNLIDLSIKEYTLLASLVRNLGKVIPHRELFREVWGDLYTNDSAMLALYIHYLRKKISDGQYGHQYIRTHWGRGYFFAPRKDI